MPDIFVSYARSTAKQARQVADALRSLGHGVWLDDLIPAHRPFSDEIDRRLSAAKAVVVVWSADAVKSQWVQSEADRARLDGKLVQLNLDGARLPMPFDRIQCADLMDWTGDPDSPGWRRVLASVSELTGTPASSSAPHPAIAANLTEPLLAVLAFDNLSGDKDLAYFSDGVSEEILQTIARGAEVRVVGRSSSFQFRGPEKAAAHVAAMLKATHVLDGSVRRSGNTVRVAANLIECEGETTVWSDQFNRELSDVFCLQDEIAAAVASALRVSFVPATRHAPVDAEAYDLYLRARSTFQDDFAAAQEMLNTATVIAPEFPAAWSLLAWVRAWQGRSEDPEGFSSPAQARTLHAAGTALRLDPSSALATAALGYLAPFSDYLGREKLLRQALVLSPSDATVLAELAAACSNVGRFVEALSFAASAYRVDPLLPFAVNWYASSLCAAGFRDEGYKIFAEGRERWPAAEVFTAVPLHMYAAHGEWEAFDDLARVASKTDPLPANVRQGLFVGRVLRDPNPQIKQRVLREIRELAKGSDTPILAELVFACTLGFVEEVFDLIDVRSFSEVHDPTGPSPSGWANLGVIYSPTIFRDARFLGLCLKLGLCHYWVHADRWPDCADDGVLPYDFRAQARRLVVSGGRA